jgi:bifunctional DNA primase/polymerase-like protein/uncharacterized protein DUF927
VSVPTAADFAAKYRAKSWAPLPFKLREKGPTYPGWTEFCASDDTRFDGNIGVLLGVRSGGLVDVDLDCPEALALAPLVLPTTDAKFGRLSKPESHWLYACDPVPETSQFQFDKSMLVEARSTGVQTMFPPSIHPEGEMVEWASDGEPARVSGEKLLRTVGDLAGMSLLSRHWPELNGRYNVEGALIGALLRSGRTPDEVERLIDILQQVNGVSRQHRPAKSVPRLAAKLAEGKPVPGLNRLKDLLGAEVTATVAQWMRLRRQREVPYEEHGDALYAVKHDKKGVRFLERLTNFTAEITEVVTRDDGSGVVTRHFHLRGSQGGTAEVGADVFDSMTWVTTEWGPWASVNPGMLVKQHAAAAIKAFSDEAENRTVYTHMGWRKVDGRWLYLHAGGAIGAGGAFDGIAVELDGELGGYLLPPARDIKSAVQAALELFDLNAVVAAGVWRAPLTEFNPIAFSVFGAGATGTLKSALTGVAQAHWGTRWDGVRFPANWSSTTNSLEKLAFLAKDALLVVDDFAPGASRRAKAELDEKADRLLRAAGNLAGRGRMAADTSLRVTYWPRGLIAATGEDVPGGHSLRARMSIEQLGPGDVDTTRLTRLQRAGGAGLLAEAMAGYVQWIAQRVDDEAAYRTQLADRKAHWRSRINDSDHRRTPDIAASLIMGVEQLANFARDVGAIEQDQGERWFETVRAELLDGARAQSVEQRQDDPVVIFIEAIPTVLAAGRVHVAGHDGEAPQVEEPSAYGWNRRSSLLSYGLSAEEIGATHQPQGNRIGWVDGDALWLLPDPAIGAVNKMLSEQGRSLPVSRRTLGQRLRDSGWLTELGKDSPAKPVKVMGVPQRVYVMSRRKVFTQE